MKQIIAWIILLIRIAYTQSISIEKIEPPNWWTGMHWNKIQLMLYGENLNEISIQFNSQKIKINKIHSIKNSTYAFIDIEILPDLMPGKYTLGITGKENLVKVFFPINEREKLKDAFQGFDSADIIYLITPDRFANGDTSNDNVLGMRDWTDRNDILRRHGGDIQGIIDKLDYIKDLGFTAIWINPLVTNDMNISYHGYAATDLYNIDPRFGTNELYQELVHQAHRRGLKIIMDHVSNHVGMYHPWVKNPPFPDWFHGTLENHLEAYHDKTVLLDIHSDSLLKKCTTNGWFVTEMPDLNQSNLYQKNYLIQNTIWWIESTGLDGIREDTYPYADQNFLSDWAKAIFEEYPLFNIVGEVWIPDPIFLASFQKNNSFAGKFDTYLPSVTDYGLFESFGRVFNRNESISNIYHILSKDFAYSNPNMLMTFIDNHDVWRLWDLVKGSIKKYKMALTILLTTRGIPQIYYGTEIGLPGGDDHGLIRRDYPGGFSGDKHNAFIKEGRTEKENEIFEYLKKLTHLKREYKALSNGKLIHFPPKDEIYVYFRLFKDEKILIIINNDDKSKEISLANYERYFRKVYKIKNLLTGKSFLYDEKKSIEIMGYDSVLLLLK
jgi:glycosidase